VLLRENPALRTAFTRWYNARIACYGGLLTAARKSGFSSGHAIAIIRKEKAKLESTLRVVSKMK